MPHTHGDTDQAGTTGSIHVAVRCSGSCRANPNRNGTATASQSCTGCGRRAEQALQELPRLHRECEAALLPRATGLRQKVSGSVPSGIALNETAVQARADIVAVLASWSALVVGERQVRAPGSRSVDHLSAFLVRHLDWLLAHPAAADLVAEVTALADSARRATHPGPASLNLGRCVRPGCTGTVYSTRRPHEGPQVRCEAGHDWPSNQWLLLAKRMEVAGTARQEARA